MASNGRGRLPCRFFSRPDGCRKGKECTFIHDTSTTANNADARKHWKPDEMRQWFYLTPTHTNTRPLVHQLPAFFQTALRFVKTDAGSRQEVVTRLATDGGLLRIDEAVKEVESAKSSVASRRRIVFVELVLPLLQILSDKDVLCSPLLEKPLETILNYMFGLNGRRTVALFNFAAQLLANFVDDENTSTHLTTYFEATLTTFSKIIDLNGPALVLEDLTPIVANLSASFTKVQEISEEDFAKSRAEVHLARVQKRLSTGEELPEFTAPTAVNGLNPTFKLDRDAPGWLSKHGARHDNDFTDIKYIRLMPTASEIQSSRLDYLPTTDPFQSHVLGVDGLLDRQFRLLREDTVGCIRDAIKLELDRKQSAEQKLSDKRQSVMTFIYRNARLFEFRFHQYRGLDLIYEFDQPQDLGDMTAKERKTWWQNSKRLQFGAFVCLLDVTGTPIFCSVSGTGLDDEANKFKAVKTADGTNVFDDPIKGYVTLSLIDTNKDVVRLLLRGYGSEQSRQLEDIIEFPKILVASFRPTLEAIQKRSGKHDLPFPKLLAPTPAQLTTPVDIAPPAYSVRAGFRFDLSCLTGGRPFYLSPGEPFDVAELQRHSKLDDAQAEALVNALRRELALIQGPPGTGKSYTGIAILKVLIANRRKARLGPILCVCYTNHALDQLLEHLLDHGINQIVRIGSGSKSDRLQNLNLRYVADSMEETKAEKQHMWRARMAVRADLDELNSASSDFERAGTPSSIAAFLETSHRRYAAELFHGNHVDEHGWKRVVNRRSEPLRFWLEGRSYTTDLPESSLYRLKREERTALYENWVATLRNNAQSRIESILPDYLQGKKELSKAREEVDLRCLKQADIIGVTTSGLARITELLIRLEPRVMLCEEAGEVLEAHILTTLLPTVEHAILIGDHLQLRPQIQNYNLSSDNPRGKQFSLDASLFERLVLPSPGQDKAPRIPFSILETQRRMHPSISKLIRGPLYPHLKDDQSLQDYPKVAGMRQRVFWFDHEEPEAKPGGDQLLSTSHTNKFEIDMVTALVSHLARQGLYKAHQIAVLTPYLGQLRMLRSSLSHSFAVVVGDRDIADLEKEGIGLEEMDILHPQQASKTTLLKTLRLATVDNFQGEEAEVVVISLVRSNKDGKVGFLKSSNRINVLLSRAKHGMYIIGNAATASAVPMWEEVTRMLGEDGSLGRTLELSCQRHPDTPIEIKTVDDFSKFAPEGGCDLKCVQRLACGHACINKCHSDILHQAVKCLEPCQRSIRGCSTHPCPYVCGERCPGRCRVMIPDIMLPCGHVQELPCYQAQNPDTAECTTQIKFRIEACDHVIQMNCSERKKTSDDIKCTASCGSALLCGHVCTRRCADCRTQSDGQILSTNHGTCKQVCGRPYTTCQHSCKSECHGDETCPLCEARCEARCKHSACKKKCFEPCTPCAEEKCTSSCPHEKCEMPCGVPCNWTPCSKRCEEMLDCGHRCPSICGEDCPSSKYCQTCCSDEVKDLCVDFILGDAYKEIDLNEDPCIFPDCGHIVTMTNLDGHFDMEKHYSIDDRHTVLAISANSKPFTSNDMKQCPTCRGSLRNINRYGRITKRASLDEATKRLESWAGKAYEKFSESTDQAEKAINDPERIAKIDRPLTIIGSRENTYKQIGRLHRFSKLFGPEIQLRREIHQFCHRVSKEEQPYRRVWDMVENVHRRKGTTVEHVPNEVYTFRLTNYVRALALSLRLDLSLFSKLIELKRKELKDRPLSNVNELRMDFATIRDECVTLVNEAVASTVPAQQVEGHMLFARYVALENSVAGQSAGTFDATSQAGVSSEHWTAQVERLRTQAQEHLDAAKLVCERYPEPTRGLQAQIAAVEEMLRQTFYQPISNEERLQVIKAMAAEFSTTGHWYTCANGHPFTVGECGMPMEQTRCPECGAPVGGLSHVPAAGVRAVTGLEEELGNLNLR